MDKLAAGSLPIAGRHKPASLQIVELQVSLTNKRPGQQVAYPLPISCGGDST